MIKKKKLSLGKIIDILQTEEKKKKIYHDKFKILKEKKI